MDPSPCCAGCRTSGDLFASECSHLQLCAKCGKSYAEKSMPCRICGIQVKRLTKEFPVRLNPSQKQYFVGKFSRGAPEFGGKQSTSLWSMTKDSTQGSSKDKLKSTLKPWTLEDDMGEAKYSGQPDMAQAANFFLLSMHGRDFLAMPAGAWYNFTKQINYKTLSIEEAEEIMNGKRKMQTDLQNKWLQKMGGGKVEEEGTLGAGKNSSKKSRNSEGDEEEEERGDQGEDDEDRPRVRGGNGEDEEENPKEEMEGEDEDGGGGKGEEWEHDETFTDDDEAVGVEKDEQEDDDADMPAPPALKDEDEEEEEDGPPGGQQGDGQKYDKKDPEDEDEEDAEDDADLEFSPIFQSKKASASAKSETGPAGVPSGKLPVADAAKGASGKRKPTEGEKTPPLSKKAKAEAAKSAPSAAAKKAADAVQRQPVSEAEVRAIMVFGPMKTKDLVTRFKDRLQSKEDKKLFTGVLARVGKITEIGGVKYLTLRK